MAGGGRHRRGPGEPTEQAICAKTRMDKVTVHRAVQALCGRGVLVRSANPGDRRAHRLRLTVAGGALYADVAPRALELERRLFNGFAVGERAHLAATLDAVEAAALALLNGAPGAERTFASAT